MQPIIVIIAGGTGGHVMPALSVAAQLQQQGWRLHWLGTQRGLEARVIPERGIAIDFIYITGLRGKRLFTKLLAPWRIVYATWQAWRVIKKVRPNVVLGMGGFVTGPGCVAAWLRRIPVIIHEQNAIAGMTNRYLARIAKAVCSGFPTVFPEKYHPIVIGNPVRADIASIAEPTQRYSQRRGPLRLLIIGGSLGAKAINQLVPQALADMPAAQRPQVWHQTGEQHYQDVTQDYQQRGLTARIEPFIDNMVAAYTWADVVLCRAGASTVAELAAVGVASILVPYPCAVDDHQYHNAAFLVNAQAAILWRQTDDFSATRLQAMLQQSRTDWLIMANAARQQRRIDATALLATQCCQLAILKAF